MTASIMDVPVRKSIVVHASALDTFDTFIEEVDAWWPRTHHIGKSPMRRIIIEGRPGGRCYSEQMDDTQCDWGRVLVIEPPHRLVLAWQITHTWGYQPDIGKSSEVELRFVPLAAETTRVELEHRYFDRHGAGAEAMKTSVDMPNGWSLILSLFAERVANRSRSTTASTE